VQASEVEEDKEETPEKPGSKLLRGGSADDR